MNKRSKKVIVDYRITNEAVNSLSNYGFNVVFTKELGFLLEGLKGHTDLQIVKSGNKYVTCPECFDYYKSQLNNEFVVCGAKSLSQNYPGDVAYNAVVTNRFAIHNFQFTDSVLKESITEKNLIEINTKQGYAKCSVCVISDKAIITDDDDIYYKSSTHNIDVLKISKGTVKLNGFDYGFFGGATGLYKNILFINGELKTHTDCILIEQFCKKHNVDIIELKKGNLYDIGSILFI